MHAVHVGRLGLALGFAVVATFAGVSLTSAQDRPKIEITLQIPHSSAITAVAFSPDGTRLLSGSLDRTLKLWDAASGRLIRTFGGHAGVVRSVAFSPNGTRMASGSDDTTIRIWDAVAGSPMATLIDGRDGEWLAVTPSGFFAASVKGTEMLGVVRGLESYPVIPFYDQLHRPDLVEELLKGDPRGKHKDAARRLDLESILDSAPRR